MPEFKLNGKTYSGSTNYASAITYTEDDGSKTTIQDKISELNSNIDNQNKKFANVFRVANKSFTIHPTANNSVISLDYDLSDVIPEGYNPSSMMVWIVNYTNSYNYQQVTVTDGANHTGTAKIMVATTTPFSIRASVLCYKKEAFNV